MMADRAHMAHNPANRGYYAAYDPQSSNKCPGCGRSQWHVGRVTAECAFCGTALPLIESFAKETHKPFILRRGSGGGKVS